MKTELSDEQILELARQEADEDELGFIFNKDGSWSVLSFARAVLAARSALPADRLHAADPTRQHIEPNDKLAIGALLRRVEDARRFPDNTDPCVRHVQIMGETLGTGLPYPMLDEERGHCAISLLSVVACLYEARNAAAPALSPLPAEGAGESDKRDAMRYRWLRLTFGTDDTEAQDNALEALNAACREPATPEDFDAAIDAAMSASHLSAEGAGTDSKENAR